MAACGSNSDSPTKKVMVNMGGTTEKRASVKHKAEGEKASKKAEAKPAPPEVQDDTKLKIVQANLAHAGTLWLKV